MLGQVETIDLYLTGRRQRVVLDGQFSDWIAVLSGVPQGSVLGPLLFLLFINDLDLAASEVTAMAKFADDTKVGQQVVTDANRATLQSALDKLCMWSEKWGMQFNVAKCKVMHFGRNNPRFEYVMLGQRLEEVDSERDIWGEGKQKFEAVVPMCKSCGDGQNSTWSNFLFLSL
jgi:hypothetical protein